MTKGSSIWWGSLDGAEGKRLVEAESNVGFGPKGHSKIGYLLYVHESALTARQLNVQRGEFERGPVVVAERIIADSNSPHYAFSAGSWFVGVSERKHFHQKPVNLGGPPRSANPHVESPCVLSFAELVPRWKDGDWSEGRN